MIRSLVGDLHKNVLIQVKITGVLLNIYHYNQCTSYNPITLAPENKWLCICMVFMFICHHKQDRLVFLFVFFLHLFQSQNWT